MKLANMVDLGSAGIITLQVQVLPIVILIKFKSNYLNLLLKNLYIFEIVYILYNSSNKD